MTRAEIRAAIAARLVEALPDLSGRVYQSRAWPLPAAGVSGAGRMPAALVYADRMRRVSLAQAGGAPTFRTTLTIGVVLRAEGRTEAEVEATLDALADALDAAILTDPGTVAIAEDVSQYDSQRDIRAEADAVLGHEAIAFDLQFTEIFEPSGLPALTAARMVMDAIDPADGAGAHPGIAPFPAPAAPPRDSGPDGRAEAEFTVTLPQ